MSRRGLWARLVGGIALGALCVCYLADIPPIWFDEGSHLHVPKTLVQRGVYADYSADEFRYGGPVLGVGPTVLLPIAASFKVFGIGIAQARGVIVVFLLLLLGTLWRLVRELASPRVADLAVLLLVGAPAVDMLLLGRQVLGEVPALWFVVLGLLAWQRAVRDDAKLAYVLAGLAFGLAVVTKYQFLIMLGPGFGLAWVVSRWRGGWVPHHAFVVPVLAMFAVFATWQACLFTYLGPDLFATNILGITKSSHGAALALAPDRIRESLRAVLGAGAFVGLVAPALTWVFVRAAVTRDARSASWMLVACLSVANLAWFVLGSIGWTRYAVPGLMLAGVCGAALLEHFVWNGPGRASDPTTWPLRAVGVTWIVLAGPLPLAMTVLEILHPPPSYAAAMAAYLDRTVQRGALIETWEPELGVLTDHRYRFPPQSLLPAAVAYRFADGPPPSAIYDFTTPPPDFVLLGEFGAWVDVYPWDRLADGFRLVHEEGPYQLYQSNLDNSNARQP